MNLINRCHLFVKLCPVDTNKCLLSRVKYFIETGNLFLALNFFTQFNKQHPCIEDTGVQF